MPFGKYKGRKLIDVPDSYLYFISDFKHLDSAIRKYIDENIDAIRININKNKYYNKEI
jgi:hypothetical protein